MEDMVHTFLKWLPVQINLNIIVFFVPGVSDAFQAFDDGDVAGIPCPADRV